MSAKDALAAKLALWTGLDLARGGRGDSLDRVIAQRVRARGLPSASAYVASLANADDPEVRALVDLLTVGHTWFFRDEEQNAVFMEVLAAQRADPLQVWVAGSSTGEEAYTLALLARAARRNVSVLGTDINASAIDRARTGQYGAWSMRSIPDAMRTHFVPVAGGRHAIDPDVRRVVSFERHNLLERAKTAPRGSGWNLVLCRNVLIYFERDEAARTLERLCRALAPDGWLFLGASEVLRAAPPGFVVARVGARFGIRHARSEDEASTRAADRSPSVAPPEPERVAELLERALACTSAEKPAEAIALVVRALQIEPLSADARLVGGIGFWASGEAERAVEELRAALFLEPDLWVASFYLARSYEKLGRASDARAEYRKVASDHAAPVRLRALEGWTEEMVALAIARGGA